MIKSALRHHLLVVGLGLGLGVGLAACASDPKTFVDGGPIDAAPNRDGATATATVTVHVRGVTGDGAPDPTATVFLISPDGAIDAQGHPDAAGTFIGLVTPGGSVTVGWPNEIIYLETVAGVADHDELWFGSDDFSIVGAMTFTVPARAGANSYAVLGPCAAGTSVGTSIPTSFRRACGATHPLLVQARVTGTPGPYLTAAAVTPVDGATVALAGAWTAPISSTVDLRGLPAGASDLTMARTIQAGGAEVVRDYKFNLAIANGQVSTTFTGPASFGDGVGIDVNYRLPSDRFYRLELFRPTLTEAAPLDVSPTVPAVSFVRDGAAVSWTLDGAGAFDAVVFDLSEVGPLENELAHWRVIAPPTSTGFTLPDLPAPFAQAAIPLEKLRLIDSSTTDPAQFRARAGTGTWIDQPPVPAPADARWIVRDADP